MALVDAAKKLVTVDEAAQKCPHCCVGNYCFTHACQWDEAFYELKNALGMVRSYPEVPLDDTEDKSDPYWEDR